MIRCPGRDSAYLIVAMATLAGAITLAACAPAAPAASAVEPEVSDQVVQFLDDWNQAIADGDRAGVSAAYISDKRFRWFEDGALRYTSREEILRSLDAFPHGSSVHTELSDVTVRPLARDMAHVDAGFRTRVAMPEGEFAFEGVFTAVVEKTEGTWRFVGGHTSTP